MAMRSLLEHLCSYPDRASRRCHMVVLAHGFEADPILSRVLAVGQWCCAVAAGLAVLHS